ncbi:EF-hand domain-containing protein [Rhizobium sullae]|uniref:EF-hand domain-containing protein n=1 Tax=Rhizobium sullae TaxID=50338 RepID=UPI000B35A8FC|nr:EF-hand domain-containing protein [Rhizobium sullae]
MSLIKLSTMALLAAIAATGGGIASAQTQDPHHPKTDNGAGQGEAIQPGGSGTMPRGMMPGMMGRDMMPSDMMGGMPMGPMRGHMMKIMFAIADADGDGALSFEEVTAIHKRVFDKVDANKDGKVTPEEMQAFMRQ